MFGERTDKGTNHHLNIISDCRFAFNVFKCFNGGETRIIRQQDGVVDTSHYMLIVDTYTNNFVVLGSILVSAGILVGIVTYFTFIILGKKTKEV